MTRVYTSGDITKILKYHGHRQNIVAAENNGSIPKAQRGGKRSSQTRVWDTSKLPYIGRVFGRFCPIDGKSPVITIFNSKGGVSKTGIAANLARNYAIGLRESEKKNNPAVCVLGLDSQSSITLYLTNPVANLTDLSEWTVPPTASEYIRGKALDKIIQRTDLPNLDLIAESYEIAELDRELSVKSMRHKSLSKLIKELRKRYSVVIIDTSPNFNCLSECALYECDLHIMPCACEIGSYSVMEHNYSMIEDWFENIGRKPGKRLIVPTMTANNKISKQIQGAYTNQYQSQISVTTIPRTVKGAEAEAQGISVSEYNPTSPLAEAYADLAAEIWELLGGKVVS